VKPGFGGTVKRFAFELLEAEVVHNVASDAHDPEQRRPGMAEELRQAGLGGLVEWLTDAVPSALHESLHTGIAAHVRYYVELWQHTRMGVDRRLQARMVERQLTYNVLTKEYKVAPLKGEQREPLLTKDLREAQRVISDLRVGQLAPVAALDKQELYYVRVRSDVSLGGVNSWFARMTGEAEETPWVQSSLLTPVRSQ